MSEFSTGLSKSQIERLSLLLEELGEAQQWIGKILRHGYDSYDPTNQRQGDNKQLLEKELGDVLFAIELLAATDDLDEELIDDHRIAKARKVWQWLHHQGIGKKKYTERHPSIMEGVQP